MLVLHVMCKGEGLFAMFVGCWVSLSAAVSAYYCPAHVMHPQLVCAAWHRCQLLGICCSCSVLMLDARLQPSDPGVLQLMRLHARTVSMWLAC
jgi:hypothetical protein